MVKMAASDDDSRSEVSEFLAVMLLCYSIKNCYRRESWIGTLKVIDWDTICHEFLFIKSLFPPKKWPFIMPKVKVEKVKVTYFFDLMAAQ